MKKIANLRDGCVNVEPRIKKLRKSARFVIKKGQDNKEKLSRLIVPKISLSFFCEHIQIELAGVKSGRSNGEKSRRLSSQNTKLTTKVVSFLFMYQQRAIFPVRRQTSIFTSAELNFCVRNGKRWTLCGKVTDYYLIIEKGKRFEFWKPKLKLFP